MFCMSGGIMPGGAGNRVGGAPGAPWGPGDEAWPGVAAGVWLLVEEEEQEITFRSKVEIRKL